MNAIEEFDLRVKLVQCPEAVELWEKSMLIKSMESVRLVHEGEAAWTKKFGEKSRPSAYDACWFWCVHIYRQPTRLEE